ncbi:MAG TPA: L,D-transpeptidase family protein, partial [Candidatus Hydrogenedentes bacterium]|nr:L,D-transpeptidase family protein [Candidatus Hydrogenedentota bacterium]
GGTGGEREESLILVRGRVANITAVDDGEYLIGIRLIAPAPKHIGTLEITDPSDARLLLERIERALPRRAGAGPSPIAMVEHLRQADAPPAPHRPQGRARRKRALALLLLSLLLLLGLVGYRAGTSFRWPESASFPNHVRSAHADAAPSAIPVAPAENGVSRAVTTPEAGIVYTSTIVDTQPLLAATMPEFAAIDLLPEVGSTALAAQVSIPPRDAPSPAARFSMGLDKAWSLAAAGRIGDAMRRIEQALAVAPEIDPLWRGRAAALWDALRAGAIPSTLPPPLRDAFALGNVPTATVAPAFSIVISKRDHILAVYRDGTLAARFPVGLGRHGATPTGDFHIANKLTDPDWYNAGRTVKAGDAANPLGAYWMGLGNDGGPTSYGIHPTTEAASIGRDASRGCIRMYPDDAATLFRLCAIGTPVTIR